MREQKPNIVIFFVDDMGYGDVSCLNPAGRIPTPNVDRLAREGMVFTDAHSSSAVCTPSRYSLLTGRYNWRSTLQSFIVQPYGAPLIARERSTLGTLARRAGYRTGCIGKWHLGMGWDFSVNDDFLPPRAEHGPTADDATAPERAAGERERRAWRDAFSRRIHDGPTERGFDSYYGVDVPNWPPYCFVEDDSPVGIPTEFLPGRLLERNQASLPGPAMEGWSFEPLLPTWARKADEFIEQSARSEEPFLLYLPMTSPHTPLAVNAPWKGASGLDNLYADLVMETDDVFGRVLDSLDRHGVSDHTLVVFASDNGCAHYIGVGELEAQGHFPSGGFRGYKSDAWDGGHRIPCIVRWPDVVAPGTTSDALVCLSDFFATFADYLGVELSDSEGEDSQSLRALFEGRGGGRRSVVHHSIAGKFAIRDSRWKLVLCPGSGGWTLDDESAARSGLPLVQLYDLERDPGEQINLQHEEPARVKAMVAELRRQVGEGRSTPGPAQANDAAVDIWKLETMPSVAPGAVDDY